MIIHAMSCAPPAKRAELAAIYAKPRAGKDAGDIALVREAMREAGSIDYARGIALRLTLSAQHLLERRFDWIAPGPHRRFIEEMIHYMVARAL